jgi:hypothetical protein
MIHNTSLDLCISAHLQVCFVGTFFLFFLLFMMLQVDSSSSKKRNCTFIAINIGIHNSVSSSNNERGNNIKECARL